MESSTSHTTSSRAPRWSQSTSFIEGSGNPWVCAGKCKTHRLACSGRGDEDEPPWAPSQLLTFGLTWYERHCKLWLTDWLTDWALPATHPVPNPTSFLPKRRTLAAPWPRTLTICLAATERSIEAKTYCCPCERGERNGLDALTRI